MKKTLTTERAWEMIEDFIEIHESIKEEIDFNKKDKKYACYLILGGMITLLIRSVHAVENGVIEEFSQYQRVISESMDLLLFFCESSKESSRQIEAWFRGEIIERRYGNKGNLSIEERAKKYDTDIQTIKNMDKFIKTANDVLSIYFHPSYDLLTMTFERKTNSYHFYGRREEKINNSRKASFLKLCIFPVVTSFGLCLNELFLLDKVEPLKRLAEFTEELYHITPKA